LRSDWRDRLSDDERAFISLSMDNAMRANRRRRYAMVAGGSLLVLAVAGAWMSLRGSYTIDAKERDLSAANDDLKAAAAAFKATLGQGAGKNNGYALDAEMFKGTRIFIHYRDQRDKESVGALAFTMRALGPQIAPAEWMKDSPTCGEVRYFNDADGVRARQLANAASQLLKNLGYDFDLEIFDGSTNSRLAKDQPGTLEIWLPPLRSLFHDSGPTERSNARDAAELRRVPGSCANIGSRPDERKNLASQLHAPYIAIYDNDLDSQRKWIDGFLMYRFEVTNEQFASYQASCQTPQITSCPTDWRARGKPREPARFLSWSAADAYCRWAGGRLPSEFEWEKAARGENGRIWPWGNEPEPQRFQGKETGGGKVIAEVGHFPAGESPYGIADMAGNLWELTASPWPGGGHVMKGGSYLNPLMEVRASWRWVSADEDKGTDYLGFRCAIDLTPPKTLQTSR
jgi:iron(II)-dependent oxidoreductase